MSGQAGPGGWEVSIEGEVRGGGARGARGNGREKAANADGADVESVYPVKKGPAHFFFFRARERPSGCGRAIGRGMGACADRACKQKCAALFAHASGQCAARLGRERGVGGCGRARALAATPTPFCPPCRARPARPPARTLTHTRLSWTYTHTHTRHSPPRRLKQRETQRKREKTRLSPPPARPPPPSQSFARGAAASRMGCIFRASAMDPPIFSLRMRKA